MIGFSYCIYIAAVYFFVSQLLIIRIVGFDLPPSSSWLVFSETETCPISRLITRNKSKANDAQSILHFTYPLDLFPLYETTLSDRDATYKCLVPQANDSFATTTCSTEYRCPILDSMLAIANITDEHRPCSNIEEGDIINVFVLGGSVTAGTSTGGCCCGAGVDAKCRQLNGMCNQDDPRSLTSVCGWVGHFSQLLASISSQYKIHIWAYGGSTSHQMTYKFIHRMHVENITLKHSDIVFIDHSVNDATSIVTTEDEDNYEKGVEHLIRRILSTSKGSWPSIVLLEMWPFPRNTHKEDYDPAKYSGFDYSVCYKRLAEHYNLTLWSYKSVVQSPLLFEHFPLFTPALRFHTNYIEHKVYGLNKRVHPSWPVHLFYADLIGTLFMRKFHTQCSSTIANTQVDSARRTLPLALNKVSEMVCDSSHPPLADIDFTAPILESTKDYKIEPSGSWVHIEDRPNKFGLVSRIDSTFLHNNVIVPLPSLDALDASQELAIFLTHLKTYLNGGVVEITVCGTYILFVDTLWKFWEITQYSASVTEVVFTMSVNSIKKHCRGKMTPFIGFEHYFFKDNKHTKLKHDARTAEQKFRIDRIEVCIPTMNRIEWNDDISVMQ